MNSMEHGCAVYHFSVIRFVLMKIICFSFYHAERKAYQLL